MTKKNETTLTAEQIAEQEKAAAEAAAKAEQEALEAKAREEAEAAEKAAAEAKRIADEEAARLLAEEEANRVKLVAMVRDAEQYPAPHTAEVHPNEVADFKTAGWTVK